MAGESAFPGAGDFRTSGMDDAGGFPRNQTRGVSAMSGGPQGMVGYGTGGRYLN